MNQTSIAKPLRLAVLVSGGGRTMANLAEHINRGKLNAVISLVVCSRADSPAVERARMLNLPVQVVERKRYKTPAEFSDVLWPLIRGVSADLVCLAGFLSLLTIPQDYAGRVINIHPALLPSFGGPGMFGHHVHEAVLKRGCKVSGCTVHVCDERYDQGPILVQRCCPVEENDTPDTLAARVFEQECIAYPEAINLIAAGRVRLEAGRARIR